MPSPIKVAIVMPPATALAPRDAVAQWGTVTHAVGALRDLGGFDPTVHCRHVRMDATVEHRGVTYCFHTSDADLVRAVRAARPDVVHVHGIGWTRLLLRLRRVDAPIVVQHHGEPPFTGRRKWAHRLVRRRLAAYLFTGASTGQAQPWIDAGVIRVEARLCEVLEAASLLPDDPSTAIVLEGDPVVLWVGRLIPGKDPITAIDGFAVAATALPHAHLHLLATDRDMEAAVRARVAATPTLVDRVHLHGPASVDEMAGWYRAADVYLSTSLREGSGYSLIEAVTCGCVPVVSAIPSHRAIIGDLGATFPVRDAAAAGAALVGVCVTEVGLQREPMSVAGRTLLSWESVAGQLAAAYSSVIGPRT